MRWHKKVGDAVQLGDVLAEIETDKTTMEWEATDSGTVLQLIVAEGDYAPVEAPALVLGQAGESAPAQTSPAEAAPAAPVAVAAAPAPAVEAPVAPPAPAPVASSGPVVVSPRARRVADELGISADALREIVGTGVAGRIIERDVVAYQEAAAAAAAEAARAPKASPLARAVAQESGTNLTAVVGSGDGGRIVADDVRAAAAPPSAPAPAVAPPVVAGGRQVPLTGLRRRVAQNLLKSVREKPHVTLQLSVDMTEALRLRKQLLPAIEAGNGVRLSPTDIVVWACGRALPAFPYVNAHIDGDNMTLFDEAHIGLAVSLGDDGLIVPVIRDVHRKGLAEIARDRVAVVEKARTGRLTAGEISGGTFTITNLGTYGIEAFDPIIPPPQVAILGVNAIVDQVVAVNGAPAVRPRMGLSLSFDHRAVDGAPAAAFLARVKELLENPLLALV